MAASSLAQRIGTAVVLVPLVLAALFALPPLGWALFALAAVLAAGWEWARLCTPAASVGALFVVALAVDAFTLLYVGGAARARGLDDTVVYAVCGAAAAFWLLVAPWWLAAGGRERRLPLLIVGFVVLTAAWVALVELHAHSPWLVLAAMAVVWIADTAAYFAGRAFGRRKLAPAISPGKTWEGVWGALVAVAVYALLLAATAPSPAVPRPLSPTATVAFVAGVALLAAVSVVGDLFESKLKRMAGVKDSGALLPGHGGVLDRVDALLAALPLAALGATAWLGGLRS
jgi:phosphatidate cytidylyltransferase